MKIKSVLITAISASLLIAGASIASAQDTNTNPTVPGDQTAQVGPGQPGGPRGGQFGGPQGGPNGQQGQQGPQDNGQGGPRNGRRGDMRRHLGQAVADATGMTPQEVHDALMNGSTIADLLTQNDVDVQEFIDAQVAEISAHLDDAVANGQITQDQADERLANATQHLTDVVNGVIPDDAPPPRDGAGAPPAGNGNGAGAASVPAPAATAEPNPNA